MSSTKAMSATPETRLPSVAAVWSEGETVDDAGALAVGIERRDARVVAAGVGTDRWHDLLALPLGRGRAALAALGDVQQTVGAELQAAGVVQTFGEDGDVGGGGRERGRPSDRGRLLGSGPDLTHREADKGQDKRKDEGDGTGHGRVLSKRTATWAGGCTNEPARRTSGSRHPYIRERWFRQQRRNVRQAEMMRITPRLDFRTVAGTLPTSRPPITAPITEPSPIGATVSASARDG